MFVTWPEQEGSILEAMGRGRKDVDRHHTMLVSAATLCPRTSTE